MSDTNGIARPFKWIGEKLPDGSRGGGLLIHWSNGEFRIIKPGEGVRRLENLKGLGASRLAEFVASGAAEYLPDGTEVLK